MRSRKVRQIFIFVFACVIMFVVVLISEFIVELLSTNFEFYGNTIIYMFIGKRDLFYIEISISILIYLLIDTTSRKIFKNIKWITCVSLFRIAPMLLSMIMVVISLILICNSVSVSINIFMFLISLTVSLLYIASLKIISINNIKRFEYVYYLVAIVCVVGVSGVMINPVEFANNFSEKTAMECRIEELQDMYYVASLVNAVLFADRSMYCKNSHYYDKCKEVTGLIEALDSANNTPKTWSDNVQVYAFIINNKDIQELVMNHNDAWEVYAQKVASIKERQDLRDSLRAYLNFPIFKNLKSFSASFVMVMIFKVLGAIGLSFKIAGFSALQNKWYKE